MLAPGPRAVGGERLLDEGRLGEARDQFWRDAAAAEAHGDAEALACAAVGLGGVWVHEHRSTLERARVLDLQRRALAELEATTPLAHRLRVRLASEDAYLTGNVEPLWAEVDAARAGRHPLVLAEALSAVHHCLLAPEHAATRLALADELIAVAVGTGRSVDGLVGLAWRTIDLFLTGDRRAERSLRELRERLQGQRCDCLDYVLAALDLMLAVRAGRLGDAEQQADRCYQLGLDAGDADALGWYGAQLVAIRWYQGRGEELLELLGDMARSTSVAEPNQVFLAAIAALAASSGRETEARAALAGLHAGDLQWVGRSSSCLTFLLGVAEAAHALGDEAAARNVYDRLAPFAELPIMASLAVACFGSAHRPLGLAALTMGDVEQSVVHLERAVAADLALGNVPSHALSSAALAVALEQRRRPGDVERAAQARQGAIDEAHRCGMTARARAWETVAARVNVASSVTCRRVGTMWSVSVGGRTAHVPHSVGMSYLGGLIQHPGVPIPAVELASGHALTCRGQPGDPVVDTRTKEAYRRRIEDLRAEVDDADHCADLERAAQARHELDLLVDELARATGLAGRVRAFDDDAERARVSVRKALARAVARIAEIDPVVGQVISVRLVTGLRCVFAAAAG